MDPERTADAPRPAWWETLGAWLHVWTPPRGTEVPPVPWGWVAVAAAALAVAVAAVVLAVAPALDEAKRKTAAEDARRHAAARRAQAERLRHDQRATVVPLRAGPLEPQVVAAIETGARARLRAGELSAERILAVECDGFERVARGRLRGSCLAVQRVVQTDPPVRVGVPFVAVVARDRRSLAWCKVNELAGEGASFVQVRVPLPARCRR